MKLESKIIEFLMMFLPGGCLQVLRQGLAPDCMTKHRLTIHKTTDRFYGLSAYASKL